jgi:thioesterase domain-containing protein
MTLVDSAQKVAVNLHAIDVSLLAVIDAKPNAQSYRFFVSTVNTDVTKKAEYVKTAQDLLEQARELCDQKFQDAELLREAIDASVKQLGKEWYEEVTAEEMAAIKAAMVGGARGIATHSGHWYNCQNGHPVSHLL